MKKTMVIVLFSGLVGVLSGCEPSAQEKLAKIQLEQIEQQKAMQKEMLEEAAKDMEKASKGMADLQAEGRKAHLERMRLIKPPSQPADPK